MRELGSCAGGEVDGAQALLPSGCAMRLVAWALALTSSSSLTSKKPFTHRVVVKHVPAWVPHERLLGDGAWQPEDDGGLACDLTTRSACDLAARLRGVGLGGRKLDVVATPKLPRAAVRGARLEDARRRRTTSPGFARRGARLRFKFYYP